MACVLYDKNGDYILCEIHQVDYYLQQGYVKDEPGNEPEKTESVVDEVLEEIEEAEEAIKSNEEEIRALAKEKGLKRVGVKSVETLLEELEQLEASEDAAED